VLIIITTMFLNVDLLHHHLIYLTTNIF